MSACASNSPFETWYERARPAGSTADTRVMNIGEECWRAAVEACAKQVEAVGCGGCIASDEDGEPRNAETAEEHDEFCPLALAASLRESLL